MLDSLKSRRTPHAQPILLDLLRTKPVMGCSKPKVEQRKSLRHLRGFTEEAHNQKAPPKRIEGARWWGMLEEVRTFWGEGAEAYSLHVGRFSETMRAGDG